MFGPDCAVVESADGRRAHDNVGELWKQTEVKVLET